MLARARSSIVAKFLVFAIPCFIASLALGLFVMNDFRLRSKIRDLTARVGMHAAAVASALAPPDMLAERRMAGRVLTSLLADPAITCAQIHPRAGGPALLAAPLGLGCTGQAVGEILKIPLSQPDGPILSVHFTTEEIERERRVGGGFDLGLVCLSLLLVVAISVFAFRQAVTRPLAGLLEALRDTSTATFRRVQSSSGDEIGTVIAAFNLMQGRLEAEADALKAAHARIGHIYDATPTLLFCIDAAGRVTRVSEHWLRATGHSRDATIGQPLSAFFAGDCPAAFSSAETILVLRREGFVRDRPLCLRCADGRTLDVLLSAVGDGGGSGDPVEYLCVMADVTLLRRAEREMRHQAATDHLTGLPNRFALNDRMPRTLSALAGQAIAVMFIDLDNFKAVNDTHGHAAGDALLVEAARRLCAAIRPDDFVARLGGDEFAVVCAGFPDREAVEGTAQRIIDSMRRPIALESGQGDVSASIGIVFSEGTGTSARDLLRFADLAMYDAKRSGRGRYCVYGPAGTRPPSSFTRAA